MTETATVGGRTCLEFLREGGKGTSHNPLGVCRAKSRWVGVACGGHLEQCVRKRKPAKGQEGGAT